MGLERAEKRVALLEARCLRLGQRCSALMLLHAPLEGWLNISRRGESAYGQAFHDALVRSQTTPSPLSRRSSEKTSRSLSPDSGAAGPRDGGFGSDLFEEGERMKTLTLRPESKGVRLLDAENGTYEIDKIDFDGNVVIENIRYIDVKGALYAGGYVRAYGAICAAS